MLNNPLRNKLRNSTRYVTLHPPYRGVTTVTVTPAPVTALRSPSSAGSGPAIKNAPRAHQRLAQPAFGPVYADRS